MDGGTVAVLFVGGSDEQQARFMEGFDDDRVVRPSVADTVEAALSRLDTVDCVVGEGTVGPALLQAVQSTRTVLGRVLYVTQLPEGLVADLADAVVRRTRHGDLPRLRAAICTVTGVADIERHGGTGWRFLGRFRWRETPSVGTAIVTAVAESLDRDVRDITPLYDSVAPDALDRLVRGAADREAATDLVVRFALDEYVVSVSAAGPVWFRPNAA